jgi:Kelch motif
MLMGGEVP